MINFPDILKYLLKEAVEKRLEMVHSKYPWVVRQSIKNEPRHDKTNKVTVRRATTQISLGIRPVWSESSLSAWRNIGPLDTYWAHSEDSYSDWADAQACPGWSESSLGAHSFCWFCHVAAQITFAVLLPPQPKAFNYSGFFFFFYPFLIYIFSLSSRERNEKGDFFFCSHTCPAKIYGVGVQNTEFLRMT